MIPEATFPIHLFVATALLLLERARHALHRSFGWLELVTAIILCWSRKDIRVVIPFDEDWLRAFLPVFADIFALRAIRPAVRHSHSEQMVGGILDLFHS